MKKVISVILIMFLLAICVYAEEKIVKVAQNNVEIQQVYEDPQTKEEFIASREVYGQMRIDEELAKFNKEIEFWTNVDMKKYRDDKLAEFNAKKAKIEALQVAMNKPEPVK